MGEALIIFCPTCMASHAPGRHLPPLTPLKERGPVRIAGKISRRTGRGKLTVTGGKTWMQVEFPLKTRA